MSIRVHLGIAAIVFAFGAASIDLGLAQSEADRAAQAIEAVAFPKWEKGKEENKQFMSKYMSNVAAAVKKKNSLILAFYRKYPDDPRTVKLMGDRWSRFEGGNVGETNAYTARIVADIKGILSEPKAPKAIIALGDFHLARIKAEGYDVSFVEKLKAVNLFIAKYPNDSGGADLLADIAMTAEDSDRRTIMNRVLVEYPNSRYGPMFKGAIRQMESIGQVFELKFTDAISGVAVDVGAMKGKVVLIDFWATWCGPCVAKMPELKAIYTELHSKGLEVIGVSLDQPEKEGGLKALREFVAKNSVPWPMYYQGNGWDSEFSTGWGILMIPTVFLIDKNGVLKSIKVRDVREEVLNALKG